MRRLTMPVGAIMTDAQSRAGQDVDIGARSGRGPRGRIAWITMGAIALTAAAIAGFVLIPPIWRSAAGRAPKALVLPGVVEAQEVRLGSKVGGRVSEVHILEGDRVGPGVPVHGSFPTLLAIAVPFCLGMIGLGLAVSTRAQTRDA